MNQEMMHDDPDDDFTFDESSEDTADMMDLMEDSHHDLRCGG